MPHPKKSIIVTGASGFVGRNFITSVKDYYRIYAMARRSRHEAGLPFHPNIHWIQCDLGNSSKVDEVADQIIDRGGADYCLHLAAYYDFSGKDNPEYERTNIVGTKNVLEMARKVGIERFLFASSIAACEFRRPNTVCTEKSTLDAEFPYATSKRRGEAIVEEYSEYFSCTNVRLTAIFSDWCEYPPLFRFLQTWLSRRYDSRIIAGRGLSAVPYIHVHDVNRLFQEILRQSSDLPRFDTYIASPDGSTSHKDLFRLATHYHYGQSLRPIYMPKLLAYIGIPVKQAIQRLHDRTNRSFERLWMANYIDCILDVDASYTRQTLNWDITPRYSILRRLLFLLERMISHPVEWRLRNEEVLKVVAHRANLVIYEQLLSAKEQLLAQIGREILAPASRERFARYHQLKTDDFQCYLSAIYHLLMATVRSGDRSLTLDYASDIAVRRFAEGFTTCEICNLLTLFSDRIVTALLNCKELSNYKQEIYDYVGMTIQLAQDRIEDVYDNLLQKAPEGTIPDPTLLPDCQELQDRVRQLSAIYQAYPEKRILDARE